MPMLSPRTIGILATTLAALGLASSGLHALDDDADEQEHEIGLDEAPAAIRAALADVDVDEIEVDTENGVTTYDVVLEFDGIEVELELTADAKLVGVEVESDDDDDDN